MTGYQSHSDEALLSLLKNSDEKAFTELYNRYWDKLLIRGLMRHNSLEDMEELLHDIFVKLWKRRESLEIKHSFHTYIAAMLKYELLQLIADRKRTHLMDPTGLNTDIPTDNSTNQHLDFIDLQQQLEQSVSHLPDKCQLVFRMSREQGLSQKQIAQQLDITPKTVENHINRALRVLRTTLQNIKIFLF